MNSSFSEYVETCHGGPQGSVIMLFAWLIYINDTADLIRESKKGMFVDDLSLYLADEDQERVVTRLNEDLQRIYNWSIVNHGVQS